jgi:hypothetical protein
MDSNPNQPNQRPECQDFLRRVEASLDGCLSPEEEAKLLSEIPDHACCLQDINIARCYKSFLAQKVSRLKVDPSLIETIRIRISLEANL